MRWELLVHICPYCGRSFKNKKGLKLHIKQMHPFEYQLNNFGENMMNLLPYPDQLTINFMPAPIQFKPIGFLGSNLIEDIYNFTLIKIKNEEDLEKQLFQYLKAKGYNVKRQIRMRNGLRVDLFVDGCIIELKIVKNRSSLQRLIGQVADYRQFSDCIIVLLYDPENKLMYARELLYELKNLATYIIIKN